MSIAIRKLEAEHAKHADRIHALETANKGMRDALSNAVALVSTLKHHVEHLTAQGATHTITQEPAAHDEPAPVVEAPVEVAAPAAKPAAKK